MIIDKSILKQRPGMTIEKADAVFSGHFSAWIQGEPVPSRYRSRLQSIFGVVSGVEETAESKAITNEEQQDKPKKSKRKRRI